MIHTIYDPQTAQRSLKLFLKFALVSIADQLSSRNVCEDLLPSSSKSIESRSRPYKHQTTNKLGAFSAKHIGLISDCSQFLLNADSLGVTSP